MRTDGQKYLDQLACSPHNAFEKRFSRISLGLGLGDTLNRPELTLLYQATLYAALCNIAFNGLGGCCGEVRPEREANRINLERHYMVARDRFNHSTGWEGLPDCKKVSIRRIFLNIFVVEDN